MICLVFNYSFNIYVGVKDTQRVTLNTQSCTC